MAKTYFTVPRLWAGETVYIIGGGPSVNDVDLDLLKGKRIIGCNNAFELDASVDVCWSGDNRWLIHNKEKLRHFGGLKLTCVDAQQIPPGIMRLKRGPLRGIYSKTADTISWNHNTGASAINVAYHFGAKKIVLIGYDMQQKDGVNNWHTNHPKEWGPAPTIYQQRFIPQFDKIKEDAEALKLEIVNATPNSALTHFPFVELKDTI